MLEHEPTAQELNMTQAEFMECMTKLGLGTENGYYRSVKFGEFGRIEAEFLGETIDDIEIDEERKEAVVTMRYFRFKEPPEDQELEWRGPTR